MAKSSPNSYPLDGIRADISIIETIIKNNRNDIDRLREHFKARFVNSVVPNLQALGEDVFTPKTVQDCIDKLNEIIQVRTPIKKAKPNFNNAKPDIEETTEGDPESE
jgi:hypothetical protein